MLPFMKQTSLFMATSKRKDRKLGEVQVPSICYDEVGR